MKKSSQILESILTHDESFVHALLQKLIEFNDPKSSEPGISPQDFSIEFEALVERHEKLLDADSDSEKPDYSVLEMNGAESREAV